MLIMPQWLSATLPKAGGMPTVVGSPEQPKQVLTAGWTP